MSLIGQMKLSEYEFSTKGLAVNIFIAFLVFLFFMLIMQWMFFFPNMEDAYEETKSMIERTGGEDSGRLIHGEYIGEIKFAQVISFICFGLLDAVFAFMLWKGKAPKSQEITTRVLSEAHSTIRMFSAFVIIMLSISILIGDNPRIFMNLLYLIIAVFSVISLIIILYFQRKFLTAKMKKELVFKIPDEATH